MPTPFNSVIVTCEHARAKVPRQWQHLFVSNPKILESHRAWDPGAETMAKILSRTLHAQLFCGRVTRLLVDLNRSPHNPRRHSEYLKTRDEREKVDRLYYDPYRDAVEQAIVSAISGRILHLSIHSFTPIFKGKRRTTDIGLLYDPQRRSEKNLVLQWAQKLNKLFPSFTIHRNQPYRGNADGLTTYLRRQFQASRYVGVEVEVNHKHLETMPAIARSLAASLLEIVG